MAAVVVMEIVVCANVRIDCSTSSVTFGGALLSSGVMFESPLSRITNSLLRRSFLSFLSFYQVCSFHFQLSRKDDAPLYQVFRPLEGESKNPDFQGISHKQTNKLECFMCQHQLIRLHFPCRSLSSMKSASRAGATSSPPSAAM